MTGGPPPKSREEKLAMIYSFTILNVLGNIRTVKPRALFSSWTENVWVFL